MAQDMPIIPEALVKKRLLEQLKDLQSEQTDPAVVKQQFEDILRSESKDGIISQAQAEEYSSWTEGI